MFYYTRENYREKKMLKSTKVSLNEIIAKYAVILLSYAGIDITIRYVSLHASMSSYTPALFEKR